MTSRLAAFAFALVIAIPVTADAAAISLKSGASGRGTIVNDGTGDASNVDGGVSGSTSTLLELGFTEATLLQSLMDFTVFGALSPNSGEPVVLSSLLVFLTLDESTVLGPTECAQCGPTFNIFDVNNQLLEKGVSYSGILAYEDGPGQVAGNPRDVLIQGELAVGSPTLVLGTTYEFSLSPAQVLLFQAAILAALNDQLDYLNGDPLTGLDLGDIRLGFSVSALGEGFDPQAEFATAAVPEPGSLLLLGTGLTMASARARRRLRRNA